MGVPNHPEHKAGLRVEDNDHEQGRQDPCQPQNRNLRGSDQTGGPHGQLCLHHGGDNKSESVRLLSFSLTNNTVEIKCLTQQMFKKKKKKKKKPSPKKRKKKKKKKKKK